MRCNACLDGWIRHCYMKFQSTRVCMLHKFVKADKVHRVIHNKSGKKIHFYLQEFWEKFWVNLTRTF
ncbi:hypothetical protein C5167_049249 [Papaver somniferum]|uniref:Uncharacterized protein n=1 Tax=Papaver somniferum TaxID=3469 RepID=A0A4Y7KLP3_PAPSO|nr:hypothetical protein C5167_049249 [Papaver somniferum]